MRKDLTVFVTDRVIYLKWIPTDTDTIRICIRTRRGVYVFQKETKIVYNTSNLQFKPIGQSQTECFKLFHFHFSPFRPSYLRPKRSRTQSVSPVRPRLMNNQVSLTNTATHIASHHGNISRLTSSRIMGIDSHESHPLERDKDKDAMDTSIDRPHNDESKGSQADRSLGSPLSAFLIPPFIQEPLSEGKSSGISAKQNGKTSSKLYLIPFQSTLG